MAISITITTGQSKENIDELTSSLKLFSLAVTSAHKRLGTLNAKFARLQQVTSGVSPAMSAVAGKTNQLTGSYNQLNRQVSTAASASTKHSKSLAGLLPHVVAVTASYMAMRKMLRGVVAALKSAIDFEHRMTIVGAVSRASAEEMVALGQAARDAGESTVWTATESATALKYLSMAGFNAEQSIGALGGVLQIAMIGEMDLGRATDIVTDVLNSMQLQISDLSRVNDVFVGTITRSNTNIEQLGHAFQYVGPIAGELGYSIEEVSAMLGTLAQSGIKGGKAGRNLAQILVKNVDAARRFGMEGAKVNDVLKVMQARETSVTEMKKRFGMVALKSALILRSHTGDYEKFAETLNHVTGEADALASKVEKDLLNQFKLLRSAVDETTKGVFDLFKEDLRDAIGDATDFVRDNKEAVVAFMEGLKDTVGGVIHYWDTWLGIIKETYIMLQKIGAFGGSSGPSVLGNAATGAMTGFALAGPAGAIALGGMTATAASMGYSSNDAVIKLLGMISGWLDKIYTFMHGENTNNLSGGGKIAAPEYYNKKLFDAASEANQVKILNGALKELKTNWLGLNNSDDFFGDETLSAQSLVDELPRVSARLEVINKDAGLKAFVARKRYEEKITEYVKTKWKSLDEDEQKFMAKKAMREYDDAIRRKKKEADAVLKEQKKMNDSMLSEEKLHARAMENIAFESQLEINKNRNDAVDDWGAINAEIIANEEKTMGKDGKMVKVADEGFKQIGDLAETQLTAVFQGEFTSIGGFFKDTLDSMYSMFTSWASKLMTKKVVVPVVMAMAGGANNAFGQMMGTESVAGGGGGSTGLLGMPTLMTNWGDMSMALGDTFSGLGMYGTADFLGGLSNTALNIGGGFLAGLPDLLSGNYAGAGLTTAGSIIGGMTPLGPLGAVLGGMLGHIAGGLFGGGHSYTPYIRTDANFTRDDSGNIVGAPADYSAYHGDYSGKYVWSHLHGGDINDASAKVDDVFATMIDTYAANINAISNNLPDDIKGVFDSVIDGIAEDFHFLAQGNISHPEEWLQTQMEALGVDLDEAFQPTIELFGQLADVLASVTPAFDSLLSTMGSATSQYFGGLTGIDQQIMDAGGANHLNDDLAWQADTYKLLFDNAVANGSSQAFALGQQYANSLVGFSSATGVNITSELEQIREQMLSVAGNPADFQAAVLQTLKDFKAGVEESINSISEAITELHPDIKLNMNVDLDIEEGGGYSYQYNSSLRKTA